MLNKLKKVNIISFTELDSTNNYAKNLIKTENPEDWTVINADFQYTGRGQQGNTWESKASKNLTFSVILKPLFLKPAQQFNLNKAISLGVLDFLKNNFVKNIKIKWPNDIYVDDKKIAGILIENIIYGNNYVYCVAGIGLNINQLEFSENVINYTSLKKVKGKTYDTQQCLSKLLNCLYKRYLILINNPDIIDKDYYNNMYLLGLMKLFKIRDKYIEATIIGTDEYGMLLLKLQDNTIISCNFKEIVFSI